MDDDFMDLGDTGWIPVGNGCFVNVKESKMMDESGNIYELDDPTAMMRKGDMDI